MAENVKKFLDYEGLKTYNGKIKAYADNAASTAAGNVNTNIRNDYKVKDVDKTDNGKVALTLNENGVVGVTVNADVVKDSEYSTVKANANNSAAAWDKFLEGITDLYPNNVTPGLKDLATTASVTKAIKDGDDTTLAAANAYADGLAKNYDAAGSAEAAKTAAISAANTYTDGVATTTLNSAKSYADGLAKNYDAAGAAAQALVDAKAYTDTEIGKVNTTTSNLRRDLGEKTAAAGTDTAFGRIKALEGTVGNASSGLVKDVAANASAITALRGLHADNGVGGKKNVATEVSEGVNAKVGAIDGTVKDYVDTAKAGAISEANTYTNTEIGKVNDKIATINTSIAGGVHFIGISSSVITDKGTETPTIEGWNGTVNKGDIVINNNSEEFIWDGTKWQKLGDTTKESQRITALEGHVNTLIGGEDVDGSVAKALKDAKDYADTKKTEANSYTDTKIVTLVGPTGQVGINKAAIETLNANAETEGSVAFKIAQAVSNIEASIDTITADEINALFA